ncbi:MAG: hypothetical protein ACFFCM_11915 [Promethearchaeota archaeon]
MDELRFSSVLKKMKKSRIIRLKEILFEMYGFERNKYEISKIVGVTAQAIGPEIDLLENVDLLKKIRVEKRRGLPSYYYTLNIESLVDSLNLDVNEKGILKEGLIRFQSAYRELKNLERERKISKIETSVYEGLVPNNYKLFILQFISSILIIAALLFDFGFSMLPDFLKNNQQLFFILQNYANELQTNLKIEDTEMNNWISEKIKTIGIIYQKIWNELMQSIVMATVIKEPSMKIMDKFEETKEEDLKVRIEKFRNYKKGKIKIDELITEQTNIKNKCDQNLRSTVNTLLGAQKKVLNDEIIVNKLDTIYNRLSALLTKIKSTSLGMTAFGTETEKIEAVKIIIAILKALNEEIDELKTQLTHLNQSLDNEKFDEVDMQMKSLFSITRNLEKFQDWHTDPKEFLEKPVEKSKIDKKELDNKILALVNKNRDKRVVLLSNFIAEFSTAYPNLEATKSQIVKGIQRVGQKTIYPQIEKIKLEKKKEEVVRLDSTDEDQIEILQIANTLNGRITIEHIQSQLEWPVYRAKVALEDLVTNNKLHFKSTRLDGDVYYIPGVL